jgi:hypothetical protein
VAQGAGCSAVVRGRAWVSLWGGAGHWLNAAEPQVGPMQVWRVGRRGVGEKKIVFLHKLSPNCNL